MWFRINKQRGDCDILKNANEKHNVNYLSNIVNLFRKGGNFFRNGGNFFRKAILINNTLGNGELMRSSLGPLSVVGRWNKARYKRGKRECNLNKKHFFRLPSFSKSLSGIIQKYPYLAKYSILFAYIQTFLYFCTRNCVNSVFVGKRVSIFHVRCAISMKPWNFETI